MILVNPTLLTERAPKENRKNQVEGSMQLYTTYHWRFLLSLLKSTCVTLAWCLRRVIRHPSANSYTLEKGDTVFEGSEHASHHELTRVGAIENITQISP